MSEEKEREGKGDNHLDHGTKTTETTKVGSFVFAENQAFREASCSCARSLLRGCLFCFFFIGQGLFGLEYVPAFGQVASLQDTSLRAQSSRYVRISRDSRDEPQALETSIVRLLPPAEGGDSSFPHDGYVDLIAAVHVGELAYYEELNRRFQGYDAVLFELVAPKNFDVSAQKRETSPRGQHPISLLQMGMKSILKLEFQLDRVNYKAPNFVHADMSPEELSTSMASRNESFMGMLLKAMAAASAKESRGEGKPPDVGSLFLLMFDDARALALRRIMAREFEDIDMLLDTLNGTEGSSIITERNKVALRELGKVLGQGKRRIAIFYGGAHMPDFERQLGQSYGLKPSDPEWLLAWRLAPEIKGGN